MKFEDKDYLKWCFSELKVPLVRIKNVFKKLITRNFNV